VSVAYRQFSNFSAISWRGQVNFQSDNDEVRFVLEQHPELHIDSASSTEYLQKKKIDVCVLIVWFTLTIVLQTIVPFCQKIFKCLLQLTLTSPSSCWCIQIL
jgi:hypothetical protein